MKYFDIYGENYYLRFNNNEKYFSNFGIIIGLFSFIFFGIYIIIQINDILSHKKFNLITNRKKNDLASVNLKNINFLININDEHSEIININSSYFDIKLEYYTCDFKNLNYSLEEIKDNSVNDSSGIKYIKNFYLEKNYYLQGRFGQNFMSYLTITVDKCRKNNCINEKELNEIIKNSRLNIFYNEIEVDNFNYSNPLQFSLKFETIPLSNNFNEIYNFFFEQTNFISENEIFNKKNYTFYNYISKDFDIDYFETNPLLTINFLSSGYYLTTYRKYLGIKDFLESLILLFQFNFVVVKNFVNYFRRNSKSLDIVHKIFYSKKTNNENKINNNYINLLNRNKIIKNLENEMNKSLKINRKSKLNNIKIYQSNNNNCNNNNKDNSNIFLNNFHLIKNFYKNINQIKLKWYNYIIPNFIFIMKKNKNNAIIILNNLINLIYKTISVENIYEISNKIFLNNENKYLKNNSKIYC